MSTKQKSQRSSTDDKHHKDSAISKHKERVTARIDRRLVPSPTEVSKQQRVQDPAPNRSLVDKHSRAQRIIEKRQEAARKPKSGKGRGIPKRDGGGGKGTWGVPGTGDLSGKPVFDENDPNYDSEDEDKKVMYSGGASEREKALDHEGASRAITDILHEYLQHEDSDDVADSACELNLQNVHDLYLFAKLALYMAFDSMDDTNRELVSVLISDLFGYSILAEEDVQRAFAECLEELADTSIDCPEASSVLAKFLARSVADDCVPPKFIQLQTANFETNSEASKALKAAHSYVNMSHGLVELDTIWNSGDFRKPVKQLVKKFKNIYREYLQSIDFENLTRSLSELGVPHFHHELVYLLTVKCLEENSAVDKQGVTSCHITQGGNGVIESSFELLEQLTKTVVVTQNQFEIGLKRVYQECVDLAVDIPGAFLSLEAFACRCEGKLGLMSGKLHGDLKHEAEVAFTEAGFKDLMFEKHGADA